jgi:hypothetical protein
MTFHHEFWVTVGTVAPVIGLAHAVVVGRNLDSTARLEELQARDRSVLRIRLATADADRAATQRDLDEVIKDIAEVGEYTTAQASDERIALNLKLSRKRDIEARLGEQSSYVDEIRGQLGELDQRRTRAVSAVWMTVVIDLIAWVSWLLCTFALVASLVSLMQETDEIPSWIGLIGVALPMTLLVVGPALDQPVRSRFKALGMDQDS